VRICPPQSFPLVTFFLSPAHALTRENEVRIGHCLACNANSSASVNPAPIPGQRGIGSDFSLSTLANTFL
jgi:hypothetical protein